MNLTAVFTTGAFVKDAPFWFQPLADELEPHGIAVRAVELASCGDQAPLGDLHDDAAAIQRAIDEIDGPIILAGHSYGGLVITEAAAGRGSQVKHLLYLSGIVNDRSIMDSDYVVPETMPEIDLPNANLLQRAALKLGMTPLGMRMFRLPGALLAAEKIVADATVGEGPGAGAFKSNELRRLADKTIIDEGLKRVTRQSVSSFLQRPSALAYQEIPSTYVLGLNDGEVPREQLMRQASRCSHLVQVPTNHFCHLDRPDLVSQTILLIAHGLGFPLSPDQIEELLVDEVEQPALN